jgi:hypothetical protein
MVRGSEQARAVCTLGAWLEVAFRACEKLLKINEMLAGASNPIPLVGKVIQGPRPIWKPATEGEAEPR